MTHIRKSRGRTNFRLNNITKTQVLSVTLLCHPQWVRFALQDSLSLFQNGHKGPGTTAKYSMSRSPRTIFSGLLCRIRETFLRSPQLTSHVASEESYMPSPKLTTGRKIGWQLVRQTKEENPLDLGYSCLYLMVRSKPANRSDEWVGIRCVNQERLGHPAEINTRSSNDLK